MENVPLFIILVKVQLSFCHNFVMTPLDHLYCLDRSKSIVMNKVSVGHKMLSLKIDPNAKVLNLTKSNSLCSPTLLQPLGNRVKHVTNKDSSWSYWYLSIKIFGQFSSCADYLLIGEISEDYSENDVSRSKSSGIRLHCRSQLPAVIQTKHRQILVWWHWSRETQPKLVLEISSYIKYHGPWSSQEKIKVCSQSMGYWCGDTCIHGGMRCDGVSNCDSFSLKEPSSFISSDESNCHIINNFTGVPIIPGKPYYESVWIGNSLYILLAITILILLVSACKICLHNSNLASRLRKSHSVASIQSSSSSSNYDKPDNIDDDQEEVYAELPTYEEVTSKQTQSPDISIDEITHEEILATSSECLGPSCSSEVFQTRLIGPNKQSHNVVVNGMSDTIGYNIPSQSQSQSSSQYQSNVSVNAPLTSRTTAVNTKTTDSLTGNILAHGHEVIARLNLPGSTRTLRQKFSEKLRTSSYDKINEGVTSSPVTYHKPMAPGHSNEGVKSKSYTISRLEMNNHSRTKDDDYFTSFVII